MTTQAAWDQIAQDLGSELPDFFNGSIPLRHTNGVSLIPTPLRISIHPQDVVNDPECLQHAYDR
jgi:hypothetical protein